MSIGRNVRVFVRQWHNTKSEWRWRRQRRTCEPAAADANPLAVAGAAARRDRGEAGRHYKAPRPQAPQREEKTLPELGGESSIAILTTAGSLQQLHLSSHVAHVYVLIQKMRCDLILRLTSLQFLLIAQ